MNWKSWPLVGVAIMTMLVAASCSDSPKSTDPVDSEVESSSPESSTATTVSSEPCAPSHLATELDASSLELVDDLCDGSWAVVDTDVALASAGLALARDIDGVWTFAVTMPAPLCRDDLVSRAVPTEMVAELDLTCETFALASTELTDDGRSGPIRAGTQGGRVGALQRELFRQGLLSEVAVDGLFGPISRRAVLDYQFANALPLTGEADDAMLRLLHMLPDERQPAVEEIVISEDHLGDFTFGDQAEPLIAYLTDVLGPANSEWFYPGDPEDYSYPVVSMSWSGLNIVLSVSIDRSNPRLCEFSYGGEPELNVVTSTGAHVGDSLERWLELYPGSAAEDGYMWITRDSFGDPLPGISATFTTVDGIDVASSIFVGPIDGCWGP